MNPDLDFSPTPMSYVSALRGVSPRRPGESFAYAELALSDPARLVCLAASNPEGKFYGLIADVAGKAEGEKLALQHQVSNIVFIAGRPNDYLNQTARGIAAIPSLHYLCCDERNAQLTSSDRAAVYALAEKLLLPGGLFGYGYRAYDQEDGALRFLVREFAPEMDANQAREFLQELKKFGPFYFARHPEAAAKLDRAIAAGQPDQFFADYDKAVVRSGSFDTIVALRPRGFAYVGDADIGSNYIELAAPASAHELIVECRENHLYEPIKDFALNRQQRRDIWCRQPAPMSQSLADLFGSFVYGITVPRENIGTQIKTEGKPVDLSAPLFSKLIDLMTLVPLSIGDFLAHPAGKAFAPADVIAAIQVLIACGIARPMRGQYQGHAGTNLEQPRLAGAFNQYLDKTQVTGHKVWLSSPMAGSAVAISARDALVMQALNRAGLANSVSALLPELQRLARDPAVAARIMDVATPTSEVAGNMIKDTVSQSIIQWYAYGLLEAA